MVEKLIEKGRIFLGVAWACATSSWVISEKFMAIVATIAAIVASIFTSYYYYRENKRREKMAIREKEYHNKRMNE